MNMVCARRACFIPLLTKEKTPTNILLEGENFHFPFRLLALLYTLLHIHDTHYNSIAQSRTVGTSHNHSSQ